VVVAGVALVSPAVGQGKAGHASLHWFDPRAGGLAYSFAFGDRVSGSRVSSRFRLVNSSRTRSGKLKLTLTGSSAFSLASDKCSKKSIGHNLSCWVGVAYAPAVVGTTDTATLTATGGNGASASLSLSGSSCSNAVAPGHLRCWGAGVNAALPANARLGGSYVSSVSCSSAGNCSAVGEYADKAGHSQGLLLTKTGGSWSTGVEASLPANASATNPRVFVDSVSCSSAGNCGAVGSYVDDTGHVQGLLLTETAGLWSTGVEADLPANAGGVESLNSISCASAGNCSAVGLYVDKSISYPNQGWQDGVLLTETAGSWATGVELALPAGAYALGSLGQVSCGSAGNCSAVGTYSASYAGPPRGLLVNETNGSWGPGVDPPLPADANSARVAGLSSVSCTSAGNCTAVGVYNGSYYDFDCDKYGCDSVLEAEGLLLTETAGTWSADAAALPSPAAGVESLASVSCSSPGNCSAVGNYIGDNNSVDTEALALTETDGNWSTGVEVGDGDYPVSISCSSPGNCGAATYNGYLLVQTDGTWSTGFHPSEPARNIWNGVESVSCTPDGGCAAVGWGQIAQGAAALLIG
jgi:hypothetical protein